MSQATFKLVEACSGTGDLLRDGTLVGRVEYRFDRYQGMREGSGMPVPGLFRIEGSIAPGGSGVPAAIVGSDATLRLDDGRTVRITIVGPDGSIRAEGHGPGRGCGCC
jgi:hypothetical protein